MSWNRAHFGAWCVVSAPLILGLELTDAKLAPILDIIGNKHAIAVNQAWAGHPGMLVANIIAPPQTATPDGAKLTVPSDSPGDYGMAGGAGITGGRGSDASTSGASDIRTGGPGSTSQIRIGTGVIGCQGAMAITSLSMSFRYLAGYTPAPGQTKKASVVTVQLLEMKSGKLLQSVWTSPPLGNYSWDHGDKNSPPIEVRVSGLNIGLSLETPVIVALSVANNDRNLQIPIDDKSGGMHVELGFSAASLSQDAPSTASAGSVTFAAAAAATAAPTASAAAPAGDSAPPVRGRAAGKGQREGGERGEELGIYPYDGSVPTGTGQLWAKPMPKGGMALLLINHGGKKINSYSVPLQTLNLTTHTTYGILDIWTQQPRQAAAGGAQTTGGNVTFVDLPPYDSAFLLLTLNHQDHL